MSLLLRQENLLRVPLRGKRLVKSLEKRAQEVKEQISAQPVDKSVGMSVVIRTKNDEANIGLLLDDIRANQEYFAGPLQVILVDTESSDNTVAIAKRYEKFFEVTVVTIKQAEFDYAKSLNLGFAAAKYGLVYTIVGHSTLANKLTLAAASLYAELPDFVGGFCYPMPNGNASLTERLYAGFGRPAKMVLNPPTILTGPIMGMMGANCSLVRREVWEKLGGYDERYAAGGEDAEFGNRALAAGYKIMVDPLLAAHHSHGLGFAGSIQQLFYWCTLAKPMPFKMARLAKFRRDDHLFKDSTGSN